jgi:hypothetical protein
MEVVAHLGEEIQLLAKFLILGAVGDIAPGGDIAVVDHHPVGQPCGHVAGMAEGGEIFAPRIF